MSLLYISEHEFAPGGFLKVPPLRSYQLDLKDDEETATEEPAHGSTQIVRLYAEVDCTVYFGDLSMRLAADRVEVFAVDRNLRLRVTAIDV